MVRRRLLFHGLTVCALSSCSPGNWRFETPLPPDSTESFRKPLMVQGEYIAGTGLHFDFPLLISLEDPELRTRAAGGGVSSGSAGDIRFRWTDGSILPAEIERYDGAVGRLEAWVLAPRLVPGEDAQIDLVYGAPSPPGPPPSEVWDDYAAVWHFSDSSPLGPLDSAVGHDATATYGGPVDVEGRVGASLLFDGVDDQVEVSDPPDGSLDFGTGSFAVSVWVLSTGSDGSFDNPLYKGGGSTSSPGYGFFLGTGTWTIGLSDGVVVPTKTFGAESDFLGRWSFLVGVCDREQGVLATYAHGNPAGSIGLSGLGPVDSTLNLRFGNNSGGSGPYRGRIDEARVRRGVPTAGWVATEWASISSAGLVVIAGPAEAEFP